MKFAIHHLLLISIVYSLPKGGGGGGGGRAGSSGSSGGSTGSTGSTSSSGGTSGGSSGGTSGSGASSNTNTNSFSGPVNSPRIPSYGSTRSISSSQTNYGRSYLYGYPSSYFYSSYGYNPAYQYYLYSSAIRPGYYSSYQTSRPNSDCLSFATSDSDSKSLNIVDSSSAVSNSQGTQNALSPYQNQDTYNFGGNGTLSTSFLSITFEGSLFDFGFRLQNAMALNTTSLTDATASKLLMDLWTIAPRMNITLLQFNAIQANFKGNLFSYSNLLVLTGGFSIKNSNITISGNISAQDQPDFVPQLRGISNVYVVNKTDTSIITFIASQKSDFTFSRINVTMSSNFTIESGNLNFDGGTVEINDCTNRDPNNNGAIIAIVFGGIAFLSILACIGYCCFRRRKNAKSQALGPVPTSQQEMPRPLNVFPNLPPPPIHNIHNADEDSLFKANRFISMFPPGSSQAANAANATAFLPFSMKDSKIKISMMQIRMFADFPFIGTAPVVNIDAMDEKSGCQRIQFMTNQDVSIQCNVPMIPHRLAGPIQPPPAFHTKEQIDQCYYEVRVLKKSNPDSTMAVGFASCPFPSFRLPGWDSYSIGYHSDDGAVFHNDADHGIACGPAVNEGDVIGIGYQISATGQDYTTVFYFTHNGTRTQQEFTDHIFRPEEIYPTIGTDGNLEIEVCFGNPLETFFPV